MISYSGLYNLSKYLVCKPRYHFFVGASLVASAIVKRDTDVNPLISKLKQLIIYACEGLAGRNEMIRFKVDIHCCDGSGVLSIVVPSGEFELSVMVFHSAFFASLGMLPGRVDDFPCFFRELQFHDKPPFKVFDIQCKESTLY